MTRCRPCTPVPEEVRRAAGLLERRWTVSILWASAQGGASRFNEFRRSLADIPPTTLAQRLGELEAAGLLERTVVDARPPRVEYRLTPAGERLRHVLDALAAWGGDAGLTAGTRRVAAPRVPSPSFGQTASDGSPGSDAS
jgi:DNA-binding HxlR family transcriptional regulator